MTRRESPRMLVVAELQQHWVSQVRAWNELLQLSASSSREPDDDNRLPLL